MKTIAKLAEENNCSKNEYAHRYFKEQGCELLDDYSGCIVPMRYKCKCGREGKTSWNNFSDKGKRCGFCHETGRKKKWTLEELKELYKSKGCELLEEVYVNSKTPLRFQCGCGNEYVKLLSEFVKFPRCWDCYILSNSGKNHYSYGKIIESKNKLSHDFVSGYFEDQGYVLLSQYVDSNTSLSYKCKCGREATTLWSNFKQGKRCGYCGSKRSVKFTLEEIKQIFEEAGCVFLDDYYVNNTTSHNFKCSCGNTETIKVQYFQQGVRCSECKKKNRSGENHFAWRQDREALELDKKFRKRVYGFLDRCRRKFNTPKEGHCDEVLGYTPKELQEHIVSHPNWEKVKDHDWHLDHYFPLEAFVEHGISDFKIINALSNLQPILQSENNQKKDRYNKNEFLKWIEDKLIIHYT